MSTSASNTALEIERRYLLNAMPPCPEGATAVHIWQGYLAPEPGNEDMPWGRLRRETDAHGTHTWTFNQKSGAGLVRTEMERQITEREFQDAWPRTIGRRLAKTRWTIRRDPELWLIDAFRDIQLSLAEVEYPDHSRTIVLPSWLETYVVREVTEDPSFTNASIARTIPQDCWDDIESV